MKLFSRSFVVHTIKYLGVAKKVPSFTPASLMNKLTAWTVTKYMVHCILTLCVSCIQYCNLIFSGLELLYHISIENFEGLKFHSFLIVIQKLSFVVLYFTSVAGGSDCIHLHTVNCSPAIIRDSTLTLVSELAIQSTAFFHICSLRTLHTE